VRRPSSCWLLRGLCADRTAGDPILLDARHLAGQAAGDRQALDAQRDGAGFSWFPVRFDPQRDDLPLPKIVTRVLPLIDITERFGERFGEHPDVAEVAAHARKVMQKVLDRLAHARRLPVLG
jgi:hypothetical protein